MTRLGPVPALDGLRGVAVAAVLLYHGGVSWAPAGFLGVDIFFVLSGFLITTLLVEEHLERGRVGLRAFWTRRARRLIPALVATVVAVVVCAPLLAEGRSPVSVRFDAVASLAYVANWRFIAAEADYFDRTGGPSPLEHMWSLGVEEQFYVVWPLLALAVLGRDVWRLGALAAAGAVASIGVMALVFEPGDDTSRAYFGTDSRVHVVLIGAAAGVVLQRWRASGATLGTAARWAAGACVALNVAFLAFAIGTGSGDDEWLYAGGFALVATATALVIADVVLVPRGVASRVLSFAPLRALGWISYGVYLWHWPTFLLLTNARTGLSGGALFGVRAVATLAVAVVSAVVIENPIRRGVVLRGLRAGVVLPALAGVVAVALAVDATRRDDASADPVAASAAPPPVPLAAGEPMRVLVVGDSVAFTLGHWLRRPAADAGIAVVEHGELGCGIARGGPFRYFGAVDEQPAKCDAWPERWASVRDAERPHVVLLLVGRWEVMDRVHDGEWQHVGMASYDAYLRSELDLAVEVLSARGARVAIATAPYYRRGERPDGGIWPEDVERRVDRFNGLVREVAADHPAAVTVVDLNARTTEVPGEYTRSVDGVRLRSDGVHFTASAGRALAPWLLPQLRALVAGP